MNHLLLVISVSLVFTISCKDKVSPTQYAPPIVLPPAWSWQFDSTSYGCGNFFAYSFSDSCKVAIIASGNACSLLLTSGPRQFVLSERDSGLHIFVRVYDKDPRFKTAYFCNDAIVIDSFPPVLLETWHAVSGTATVTSTAANPCPAHFPTPYQVNIAIDSLILQKDSADVKVFSPRFEFKNVTVGWFVG